MKRILAHLFILVAACAMIGCKKEPAAQAPTYGSASTTAPSEQLLTFCAVPSQTPAKIVSRYQPLVDLLSAGLRGAGCPGVQLQVARDHADFDARLSSGRLSLAMVSGVTAIKNASHGYQVIAKIKDDEQFRALMLVRKDSSISSIDQLRGKKIAFPSRSVMGGSMMMRMFLHDHGLERDRDYTPTFCESYDSAMMMLVDGRCDAASLGALTWSFIQHDQPELAAGVSVKWSTEPLIQIAVILSPALSSTEAAVIRQTLLKMDESAAGRAVLKAQRISGFEAADLTSFLPAKEFLARYEQAFGPDSP